MKKTGSQPYNPAKLHLAPELLAVQGLMPISPDDRKRLSDDIQKNGVRDSLKVYMGDDGKYYVLAGATRLAIAQELRLPSVPIEVYDAPVSEREAFAIEENLARRHLTSAQKVELARFLLKASPDKSDRFIAAKAGVSPTTAGKIRAETQVSKMDTQPEKRIGKDGRKQAATKKPVSIQIPMKSKQTDRQRLKAEIKATEAKILALRETLARLKAALKKA